MWARAWAVDRAWLEAVEWAASYGINGDAYCPRCSAWLEARDCCPGDSHHDGCDLAAALGRPTHLERPRSSPRRPPGTLTPLP